MRKYSQQLRVGLQFKAILILTAVVVAVTLAGGWFYFDSVRTTLRRSDQRHAGRLGHFLTAAAQYHLRDQQTVALERLVSDSLRNDSVRFVAVLDSGGSIVASASRDIRPNQWSGLVNLPLSVSLTHQVNDDVITFARPVVLREALFWKDHVVGAVRLVIDTSATTASLRRVQKRMTVVAVAIVLCVMPLGYVLVWRVLVQPFRKLVAVTRRLAKGDFGVRTGFRRNDEVGELAGAFDAMATEVARMRAELVRVNEGLEKKVAQRTGEIRRTNLRLQEEMVDKEDFLRAVSHDLNAPLRNIAGMTTLIQMKYRQELPEEIVARLQRIQVNVDAEASLISELLELSRIKSCPQKRMAVDMGGLMRALASTFEFELKNRDIELVIDEDMPTLYVEKNRLRQVFQNLIDNAIKYMHRRQGGRIDVRYCRAKECHTFCVADNGPGIPPKQQNQIFQVFRRVENATMAKVEGKGVGLALVKSVMTNYDGRAWVQSEPGEGAEFFVTMSVQNTKLPRKTSISEQRETKQPAVHPAG